MLPGGPLRNHNPHVSAVVVHEREYRMDRIERLLTGEPDVEDFGSTAAAMVHCRDAVRR